MARVAGVNIPDNKHADISLTYVYGIGKTRAQSICSSIGVSPTTKISDLSEDQLDLIRTEVGKFLVEGDLRREVATNIKNGKKGCRQEMITIETAVLLHLKSGLKFL